MGYQIAVWEGKRPADDTAGSHECQSMLQRHLINDPQPPTPRIRQFVEALRATWTDDPSDPHWETSPWKCVPAFSEVSGPVILLDLALEVGVIAGIVVAATAEEHGLVAFDLMVGMLRPVSEEVIAEHARRWAGPLN